jgi:hypothetical protein
LWLYVQREIQAADTLACYYLSIHLHPYINKYCLQLIIVSLERLYKVCKHLPLMRYARFMDDDESDVEEKHSVITGSTADSDTSLSTRHSRPMRSCFDNGIVYFFDFNDCELTYSL